MFTGIILHSGTIESFDRLGNGARMRLRTTDPQPFDRGESLAVNGVCLTMLPAGGSLVTALDDETRARPTLGSLGAGAPGSFGSAMIPETLRRTNLGAARIGGGVNLEFDMVAKYVRSLVSPYLPQKALV